MRRHCVTVLLSLCITNVIISTASETLNPLSNIDKEEHIILRTINAVKGTPAHLSCHLHKSYKGPITWVRLRDKRVLTANMDRVVDDRRFVPYYFRYSNEWMLQIEETQEEDSGVYSCRVPALPVNQYIRLNVVEYRAHILQGSEISVRNGHRVKLACASVPKREGPWIFYTNWAKDGYIIDDDRPGSIVITRDPVKGVVELVIPEARPQDSGNYTCSMPQTEAVSVVLHVMKSQGFERTLSFAALPALILFVFVCATVSFPFVYGRCESFVFSKKNISS